MSAPELTITLFRRELTSYTAWARFRTSAEDDGESAHTDFQLDPVALRRDWTNSREYGRKLTAAVFQGAVLEQWKVAQRAAPLRVRLEIQDSALDLHRIRWETLCVPDNPIDPDKLLLTSQNYWFSRHLSASWEAPRVRSRARAFRRALVVIAAPHDLPERDGLGRKYEPTDMFDPGAEVATLTPFLNALVEEVVVLPNPGANLRASSKNIVNLLRDGAGFDVLYLVAHGALDGTPKLFLENDEGTLGVTEARALVTEVGQLRFPPRLAVLSSCSSAGPARPYNPSAKPTELDAALGPQLGRAGIPAVVAMLGDVSQPTANRFVETFFKQLAATGGQLERAAAEARHAVMDQPDYWSPVLYTRLPGGMLWRGPSPTPNKPNWLTGLRDLLGSQQVIPVLGSGVLEPVLGPPDALARRLVAPRGEPEPTAPPGLPRAVQYAATLLKRPMPRQYLIELAEQVRQVHPNLQLGEFDRATELGRRAPPGPGDPDGPTPRNPAERAIASDARTARRLLAAAATAVGPSDPHLTLARLKCPVYISTNPDDLLGRALEREGHEPVIRVCNWLHPVEDPPGSPPDEADPPTDARPLVYHLFGHLSNPVSLVLSEDDYFKFLVGISNEYADNRARSRGVATKWAHFDDQLNCSGLLFLGFRLDDWDFRAFLKFFLNRGAARTRDVNQVFDVAVQVDPADDRSGSPDQVRRYLEVLFERSKINIFWGTTEEFLEELVA